MRHRYCLHSRHNLKTFHAFSEINYILKLEIRRYILYITQHVRSLSDRVLHYKQIHKLYNVKQT